MRSVIQSLRGNVERVNGFGWFIHVIWSTLVLGASAALLYAGLTKNTDDLKTAIIHYHQIDSTQVAQVAKDGVADRKSIRDHISDLWRRYQYDRRETARHTGQHWDWEDE